MTSESPASQRRIVVGVDGSPSSRAALGWAARQAKLTGAVVDAVTAWHFPPGYAWAPDGLAAVELAAAARPDLARQARGGPFAGGRSRRKTGTLVPAGAGVRGEDWKLPAGRRGSPGTDILRLGGRGLRRTGLRGR